MSENPGSTDEQTPADDRVDRIQSMIVGLFIATAVLLVLFSFFLARPNQTAVYDFLTVDWNPLALLFLYSLLWLVATKLASLLV